MPHLEDHEITESELQQGRGGAPFSHDARPDTLRSVTFGAQLLLYAGEGHNGCAILYEVNPLFTEKLKTSDVIRGG